MAKEFIRDLIEPEISFVVEEASKEVDGEHILAKVKGQFFVPDGYSRNNRFYPRKLWERVISSPEIQKKLRERRMFGTIGHDTPINDETIAEGKISHIVTNLYIDEQGRGIGEALILNTPAGRVLNTLLRAGAKLYVSSRAFGEYEGKDPTGRVPALKPETYELITFDFVYEPGFLQANPQLVESIREDLQKCLGEFCDLNSNQKIKKEDLSMALDKVVEQLSTEKAKLEQELSKTLEELEATKTKLKALEDLQKKNEELSKELESLKQTLAKYEKLGKPEEIEALIAKSTELLKKYEKLGKPEELEDTIKNAKQILLKYEKLGSPEELEKALRNARKELNKVADFIDKVGTFEEVEEVLIDFMNVLDNMIKEKRQKQVEELSQKYNQPKDVVEKLLSSMSVKDVEEVLSKMTESQKVLSKYKASTNEARSTSGKPSFIFESRTARIAKSLFK